MKFEEFLQRSAEDGFHHSAGEFTVDFLKAGDKLADFALPSDNHYLLKGVQMAHRLGAPRIDVVIGRYSTSLKFFSAQGRTVPTVLEISSALRDPLGNEDPLLHDLVLCLYGTLTGPTVETRLTLADRDGGEDMVMDAERGVHIRRVPPVDCEAGTVQITLRVLHHSPWKFWEGGRRRAESSLLLTMHCGFSEARLYIDGKELPPRPASVVNEHLVEARPVRWGDYPAPPKIPAASNIVFVMAGVDQPGFAMLRPSLSGYVVRQGVMNVWASGVRVNNTLIPDGTSSAAWMLQFRKGDEDISMRWARKRDRYLAVLGLNIDNEGSGSRFQMKLIRQGVLLAEKSVGSGQGLTDDFLGCSLIFADDDLKTDLTGFQLVESQQLSNRIHSFFPLLAEGRRFFEQGRALVNIPDRGSFSINRTLKSRPSKDCCSPS